MVKQQRIVALDVETTGLDLAHGDRAFAVTYHDSHNNQIIWKAPVDFYDIGSSDSYHVAPTWSSTELRDLRQTILKRRRDQFVMHNAVFDLRVLRDLGVHVDATKVDDTLFMSHLIDSRGPHGLKDRGVQYLGILDDDEADLKASVKRFRTRAEQEGLLPLGDISKGANRHVPIGRLYWLPDYYAKVDKKTTTTLDRYALRDVERTIFLHRVFSTEIAARNLVPQYEMNRRLIPLICDLEATGVRVYPKGLTACIRRSNTEIATLTKSLQDLTKSRTFNPDSSQQTAYYLYQRLRLPVLVRTKEGNPSTGKDAREKLIEHLEEVELQRGLSNSYQEAKQAISLLEQRQAADTLRNYTTQYRDRAVLDESGKLAIYSIQPRYNAIGTATTRFSSDTQNVGQRGETPLRTYFGPRPDCSWVSFDYNQIELRILAALSGDQRMVDAFLNGEDLHQVTADGLHCPRKTAKNINFAWVYGAGLNKLAIMAKASADEFAARMASTYPGAISFMEESTQQVRDTGLVHTAGGYPLRIRETNKPYKGANYRVQGHAGEVLKTAMYLLWKNTLRHFNEVRLLLSIHDELIFELPNKFLSGITGSYINKEKKRVPTYRPTRKFRDLCLTIQHDMTEAGRVYSLHTPVTANLIPRYWSKTTEIILPTKE